MGEPSAPGGPRAHGPSLGPMLFEAALEQHVHVFSVANTTDLHAFSDLGTPIVGFPDRD